MLKAFLFVCLVVMMSGCSVFRGSSKATAKQQTDTVEAIRAVGTAVEAYHLNNGRYPVLTDGHAEKIESLLVPHYLERLPDEDGWGNEIEYYCAKPDGPYYIISLGSDKDRDVGLYKTDRSPSGFGFNVITSSKEDIIFSNGLFVRYPQGANIASK